MDVQGFLVAHPYFAAFLNPILAQVFADLVEVKRTAGALDQWSWAVAKPRYISAAVGGVIGVMLMMGIGGAASKAGQLASAVLVLGFGTAWIRVVPRRK